MTVVTKLLIREYSDLVFGEKLRVQILNKFRAQFPLLTSSTVRPTNYLASPLSTLQSTSPKLLSRCLLAIRRIIVINRHCSLSHIPWLPFRERTIVIENDREYSWGMHKAKSNKKTQQLRAMSIGEKSQKNREILTSLCYRTIEGLT